MGPRSSKLILIVIKILPRHDEIKSSKIPLFSVITAAYRAKPFCIDIFKHFQIKPSMIAEVILSIHFDNSEKKNSTSKLSKESEILKRKSVDIRILEDDKNLGQVLLIRR